jgi:hypothetical protein
MEISELAKIIKAHSGKSLQEQADAIKAVQIAAQAADEKTNDEAVLTRGCISIFIPTLNVRPNPKAVE